MKHKSEMTCSPFEMLHMEIDAPSIRANTSTTIFQTQEEDGEGGVSRPMSP